jgi:Icc-related predicted phosphoesterase
MGTKTLFISDVKSEKRLEDGLKKLDFDVDQIVIAGDLLDHEWARKLDPINEGKKMLKARLKKLKEYANSIIFLPGNTDLRPDFSEEICSALDVVQLTERFDEESKEIYVSSLFEGKGYSLISWGPGAGIGGIEGYMLQVELARRKMLPHSTITLDTQYPELINPLYSGILFYGTCTEKVRKAKSEKKIIVSHTPPYMGNDIPSLSDPKTTNEWLDLAILVEGIGNIKGIGYVVAVPTHIGDLFFRRFLNENCDIIHSVYFGHVEESKGESYLKHTYMRNLGSFGEDLYVVKL